MLEFLVGSFELVHLNSERAVEKHLTLKVLLGVVEVPLQLLDPFQHLVLNAFALLLLHLLDLPFGVDLLDLLGSCEVQFRDDLRRRFGQHLVLDWQRAQNKRTLLVEGVLVRFVQLLQHLLLN